MSLPTKIFDICNSYDRQRILTILEKIENDPNTFPLVDVELFILFRDNFDSSQRQEIIFLLDFLSVLDNTV